MPPTSVLTLAGSIGIQAPSYPPSASLSPTTPISEVVYVNSWDAQSPTITSDTATSITFPIGMTNCHVLYFKIQPGGSPIVLALTSADGTLQAIPVDDLIFMKMLTQPVTAIKVTRTAGVDTTLTYLIAQKA